MDTPSESDVSSRIRSTVGSRTSGRVRKCPELVRPLTGDRGVAASRARHHDPSSSSAMRPSLSAGRIARVAAVGVIVASGPIPAIGQSIAVTRVSVIDGDAPRPRTDQTVVIQGNRIVRVGTSGSVAVPSGARIVDGRGRFLVPGFWDMHVHTAIAGGRDLLPLYIANGVTGVRDMAGDWDTLKTWRTEIRRGQLVGPRMVASGPYLEGGDVPIPHLLARNAAEASAGVDSLIALGVDFIKVHSQLNAESYFAIARRARERGVVFAGHVPRVVGAAAASDSGQKSIEHLLAIPAECTPADSIALAPRFPVQGALGRCSTESLAPLYAKFVRNGTYVTPTFTAQVEVAYWPTHPVPGDSLAHYLPKTVRDYVAEIFPMPDSIPPNADSVGRAMLEKRLRQVAAMQRAGVQ